VTFSSIEQVSPPQVQASAESD